MEFECQHCETSINIDPEQMGSDVHCPACGKGLPMPDLPPEVITALDKKIEEENNIHPIDEGDHEVAEAMLEEPASKETTMWREKLAASFQAANISNIKQAEEDEEDDNIQASGLEAIIDTMLDYFSIKKVETFDRYYKAISGIGNIFILLFGFLVLGECIILTAKKGDALYLVYGIIIFVVSFGLYYLASKFSSTGLAIIRKSELIFYSRDIHHAFGFINLLATIILLLLGGYVAIIAMNFFHATLYIIFAIATAHASFLFLSPKVLNTRITKREVALGETGISLIGFIIRTLILLSGILLAAIPLLDIGIIYIIFDTFGNETPKILEFQLVCKVVLGLTIAPLITYIVYLIYRIFLDFYKIIFKISANLSIFLESLYSPDE
jgi:hypothetical protein